MTMTMPTRRRFGPLARIARTISEPHTAAVSYPRPASAHLHNLTMPADAAYSEAQRRLRRRGRVALEATVTTPSGATVTVRIGAKRGQGAYITDSATTNVGSLDALWRWWLASYPELRATWWTIAAYPLLDAAAWALVEAAQG
jgi:hypothetical protein